ncbi:DUF2269 family protein [Lacibacter luteus]|uniref:DUF2269 family protein n=1 Tax=Lacibacter luteus TaxID=2508719 RepID=A0A4Q1CHY0_9BACT|nr:DUF2269 family protein [Lacibacter luteus]RXK59967.1 DUF2269 family protein [Lacibacter luteus]
MRSTIIFNTNDMMYLLFKIIHLLAVVAFLGNIVIGLFWMKWAYRTANTGYLQHTVNGIIAADRIFTLPGVVVITIAGIMAAVKGGIPMLSTGWIFWSIVLFTLSGIIFMAKVGPLQTKMKNYLTQSISNNSYTNDEFKKLMKQWEFWGLLSVLTPLLAFLFMILKWPLLSPLAA